MRKKALITGATAGIGEATARRLAEEGFDLVVTGRRKDRLEILKKELLEINEIEVVTLSMDVRNTEETRKTLENLSDSWKELDVLVNNAGLAAGKDLFQEASFLDWENMIDTNVKGLLLVSQVVTRWMVKRGTGQVINISSIAGTQVYQGGSVYSATKHAVHAITKSMRIDLLRHGIKVSSISPGAAETEFSLVRFKGDKEQAKKVYSGYQPLTADDIADSIAFVINQPPHVTINDIELTATAQANSLYTHRN